MLSQVPPTPETPGDPSTATARPHTDPPDYAAMFLAHLGDVEAAVASTGRRYRLSSDEIDELRGRSFVKLIDRDYAILRRFNGRSTLRTYLTVVIERLLLDHRVSTWGKWRASARATRGGAAAILLERLVRREGVSREQAVEMVEHSYPGARADESLRAVLELPARTVRRFVTDGDLEDAVSTGPRTDAFVHTAERRRSSHRATAALAAAISRLPPQDALILRLRFVDGLKIVEIANRLGHTRHQARKAMYPRLRLLLTNLRESLEAAGVSRAEVLSFIGATDLPDTPVVPPLRLSSMPTGFVSQLAAPRGKRQPTGARHDMTTTGVGAAL